jgi:hypothetical protein
VVTRPARIWRSSLRLRLTVTGTLLAAVIFAIADPIVISLYHGSLPDSIWGSVTGAASQLAAKLESSQQVPDPIPMPVSAGVPNPPSAQAADRTARPTTPGIPDNDPTAPRMLMHASA